MNGEKVERTFGKILFTLEQIQEMLYSPSLKRAIENIGGDASGLEDANKAILDAMAAIEEADYRARAHATTESLDDVRRLAGL